MIKTPLSTVLGGAFWTPGATIIAATFEQRIKKLFANGEQGFWYDPNDLSTMFQDAAGTIPVTGAGQPVGLMLDKSKGLVLGGELWSNQVPTIQNAFGTIGAYNSATRTMINTGTDTAGYPRFVFNVGATVGKRYFIYGKLSGNVSEIDSFAKIRLGVGGNTASLFYNSQTGEFYGRVLAESDSLQFITNLSAGESLTIDSISVREIEGNHAHQTSSAARPILRSIPILGTEVIADPEFNDQSYWTVSPTINVSGGFVNFVGAASGHSINRANSIELGKTYQLTFTISSISSGAIIPAISIGTGTVGFAAFNKVGTYTVVAVASGTIPAIQLTAIGSTTATVDRISVKEVLGYKSNNFMEYDGVDDKLITTLPAQLTGCTVIRSVPNVGTQILTGQTIPATYNDNTDHCGLIVINRDLTATETSQITKFFNKAAGV